MMQFVALAVASACFLISAGLHVASYSGYLPPGDVMNALFYTIFLCCSLLAIAKRSRSFGPDFLIVLANWKRPQYLFLLILLLYTIVFILMNGHTGSIPVEKFATPKFFPESSLFLAFFYYVLALASAEDS